MGMLPAASDRITCGCRLHSLSLSLSFLQLCLVVRPDLVQNASASTSFHSSLQQCYSFFSFLLYLEYFIFPAQKTTTNHLPQAISAEITTKDQAPLEVPGNKMPETGSRRTLLHTRGFPARNDQPRLVKEFTSSSRV
ncbi:hypothetical protein V6N11_071879 [Hibiscus sabdariffa]|uniref:Uncharacterized protein n=1 Tax=Hibiscus sabdariffa TaxID=183260 RepID=A0ABR2U1D0_9ROSI